MSARVGVAPGQLAVAQQVADGAPEHELVPRPPPGQLQQPGEVVVRIGDARVDLDRALVRSDRLRAPALILDGKRRG